MECSDDCYWLVIDSRTTSKPHNSNTTTTCTAWPKNSNKLEFFFLIKCEKQETRIAFGQSMFRFFSHRCLESKMKTYRKFGWNKKKKNL